MTKTEMHGGSASDSTAVSSVLIDSLAWSATNDSSVTSSVHYDVLRDSVGRPVLDSLGAPVVYVVQRDTVWRVVTIDKGTHSTIMKHDTVEVTKRDTIVIKSQVKEKNGIKCEYRFIFVCLIIVIGGLVLLYRKIRIM